MNFTLSKIVVFSGVAWCINKIYNFITQDNYCDIFPTHCLDVDTIILSFVDKEILISLSTVNHYFAYIIKNKYFWKLRMENKLALKSNNTDFRFITNILDNNKSFSDNLYTTKITYGASYAQQLYDVLGENRKYGYLLNHIENKNLEQTVIRIYRNLYKRPYEEQYDFKEWKIFIKQTIEFLGTNYSYVNFNRLTDIMEIKIVVNYQNNNEPIIIKCNKPSKIMVLLFELSRQLDIKSINISCIENNSKTLNMLLYKIVEQLT